MDAERPARGLEGFVGAGEARRVGGGGLRTCVRAPRLDGDHGLPRRPRPPGRGLELPRILEALEIEADGLRVRVVDEGVEDLTGLDIGLVADRDAGAEPNAAIVAAVEHAGHQGAALGDDPYPAPGQCLDRHGDRWREGEARRHVDEAEAVGAEDAHSGLVRDADDLVLEGGPLRPRFGELAGDDDACSHPSLCAVAHAPGQHGGRQGGDGHIGASRDGRDSGIGLEAHDRVASRVDGVELAPVAVPDEAIERPPAKLAQVVRRADDRDGTRVEEAGNTIALRHRTSPSSASIPFQSLRGLGSECKME